MNELSKEEAKSWSFEYVILGKGTDGKVNSLILFSRTFEQIKFTMSNNLSRKSSVVSITSEIDFSLISKSS